jgi:iron(III) transport system substrate-binding protein
MTRLRTFAVAAACVAGLTAADLAANVAAAAEINIYSRRQAVLMKPILNAFTKRTGIRVNVVYMKRGMISRLKAEGRNTPADMVLTTDAARLIKVQQAGLLRSIKSTVLDKNIPAQYRHPEGYWYGLTIRARPIMYNPAKVKPADLTGYEGLADKKWRGRICIRSSSNVYNLSLISSIVAHAGKAKAQAWADSFVKNFARKPAGGDRDQIRALAAGQCDIAIANTYYLAGLAKSKSERDRTAAARTRIFWPNQKGRGAHVNVSGAGITKYAKNAANALKLLEWLSGEEAQRLYANRVYEYPVKAGIPVHPVLRQFGEFKADRLNLATLARHQKEASRIADRAGWR